MFSFVKLYIYIYIYILERPQKNNTIALTIYSLVPWVTRMGTGAMVNGVTVSLQMGWRWSYAAPRPARIDRRDASPKDIRSQSDDSFMGPQRCSGVDDIDH